MSIKKVIKGLLIFGVAYEVANLVYQLGKGRMLRLMKQENLTVDELLDIIKLCDDDENLTFREKGNIHIVDIAARLEEL